MSNMQRTGRIEVLNSTLVLVRHGQSEWNQKNLFTGWRDPDLTDRGVIEARWAGRVLRDRGLRFDVAFTSKLRRAQHTLDMILGEIGQADIERYEDQALNERDYGALAGLKHAEARERWGEDMVQIWRRSFDVPPPGGESLKDTAARVYPYYRDKIWPQVKAGRNVIVAAHGNSLRALILHLEKLSSETIFERELATGAPQVYRLTPDGDVAEYEELVPSVGRDDGMG